MRSVPYIIAFLAGLFARSTIAWLNGWEGYTLNGVDLLCGIAAVTAVWSFKATFLSRKTKERRKPGENTDSMRGKPDRLH